MQRLLTNDLWASAFPATFLNGFVAEPIATIYAPFKLACQIIGSQPGVGGFTACEILPPLYFLASHPDLMTARGVQFMQPRFFLGFGGKGDVPFPGVSSGGFPERE